MCPPEDALSPSSPVLHTAHIMRGIKYLLVFVRLGLQFLHLKTIKNQNGEARCFPLSPRVCVLRCRIDNAAKLQISRFYPSPSSPNTLFLFPMYLCLLNQSSAPARTLTCAHFFRLVLMHVDARTHARLKHLRACTLHFRRHIIHRPRGHVPAVASSIWPLS